MGHLVPTLCSTLGKVFALPSQGLTQQEASATGSQASSLHLPPGPGGPELEHAVRWKSNHISDNRPFIDSAALLFCLSESHIAPQSPGVGFPLLKDEST